MPPKRSRATSVSTASSGSLSPVQGLSASSSSSDSNLSVVSESDLSAPSDQDEPNKKRKSSKWPSERERQRKWRRTTIEERECVISEGGIVFKHARGVMSELRGGARIIVGEALGRALSRVEAKLENDLVPPLAKMPGSMRRELPSSLLSWRVEEEGGLLGEEMGEAAVSAGMRAEIAELENMLLPEAEQTVELQRALADQQRALEASQARIQQLRQERKSLKAAGAGTQALQIDTTAETSDARLLAFLRLA